MISRGPSGGLAIIPGGAGEACWRERVRPWSVISAPSYSRVIDTLEAHAARTRSDGGVWQLPEGDALYEFLVRQFTTTTMTPAQIHELGLREVAQARIARWRP
jgi:uncharacterized protein (DUF885 family)